MSELFLNGSYFPNHGREMCHRHLSEHSRRAYPTSATGSALLHTSYPSRKPPLRPSYLSPKGDIQTSAHSSRIPLLRQGRFLRRRSPQWFLSPGGHKGSWSRKTLWQVYLDGSRVCGHYCVPNHDAGPAPILFCSNNVNNKP